MAGAAEVIRETHAKTLVMEGDVSVVETGAQADFLALIRVKHFSRWAEL